MWYCIVELSTPCVRCVYLCIVGKRLCDHTFQKDEPLKCMRPTLISLKQHIWWYHNDCVHYSLWVDPHSPMLHMHTQLTSVRLERATDGQSQHTTYIHMEWNTNGPEYQCAKPKSKSNPNLKPKYESKIQILCLCTRTSDGCFDAHNFFFHVLWPTEYFDILTHPYVHPSETPKIKPSEKRLLSKLWIRKRLKRRMVSHIFICRENPSLLLVSCDS